MESVGDELLIMLVEQNPYLYDKSSKCFKDEEKKQNAWKHIATQLDSQPEIVKKKWENLRDRFVRAYRLFKDPPHSGMSADEAKVKIMFPYFEIMMWLAPHIRKRRLTTSFSQKKKPKNIVTSKIQDLSDENKENNTSNFEIEVDRSSSTSVSRESDKEIQETNTEINDTEENRSSNLKRSFEVEGEYTSPRTSASSVTREIYKERQPKKNTNDMFNKACAAFLTLTEQKNEKPEEDADYCFMKSVVADMKLLPPMWKVRFKKEIMQLLEQFLDQSSKEKPTVV